MTYQNPRHAATWENVFSPSKTLFAELSRTTTRRTSQCSSSSVFVFRPATRKSKQISNIDGYRSHSSRPPLQDKIPNDQLNATDANLITLSLDLHTGARCGANCLSQDEKLNEQNSPCILFVSYLKM